MSMIMRAVPNASSVDEAKKVVFGNWLRTIEEHHQQYSGNPILDILDVGCSIGYGTRQLADKFPTAKVTVSKFTFLDLPSKCADENFNSSRLA